MSESAKLRQKDQRDLSFWMTFADMFSAEMMKVMSLYQQFIYSRYILNLGALS